MPNDSEYTPTTEEVREKFAQDEYGVPKGRWLDEFDRWLDEFDRWLAEYTRQVKAEGWDEGEQAGLRRADFEYGHATIQAVKRNPYRKGESDE